jgi:mannosylglycerate hydrolase
MTTDAGRGRPTAIHLVPHTHWDREWYRPFQSFRMLLVDLVDRVLDMLEADPDFAFTLDGQLATVDDYLEIRPEQAERIAGHVRSGRLAIGPWLILMDEFLVSGETIVRNLEAGRERAEDFGGPMRVGYLPDMFGHIAQMPQLLRRSGLADAVVWRGVPAAIDRHAFRWESPDGSWVRAEYLPVGYGNAAGLFAAPDRLEAAAERFVDWSRPWFDDEPVLAMYGTDHTAPVPELAALVSRLNDLSPHSSLRIGTLAQYIAAAPALTDAAPCWRGELRSGARANVLMGVASARIDVKRAAGLAERLVERYAEPLTALHLPEHAWPDAFLRLAWRRVIENSAHDSICGCSIDPVTAQVLVRYAEAQQVSRTLTNRVLAAVASGVPRGSIAVLNPSPTPRDGLVEVEIGVAEDWESVTFELADGRRTATQETARHERLLFATRMNAGEFDSLWRRFHGREIFDHMWNAYRLAEDGSDGPVLTLDVDVHPEPVWLDIDEMRDEIEQVVAADPTRTWQVRIEAQPRRRLLAAIPVPALGWAAARPVPGDAIPEDAVRADDDGRGLRNGLLKLRVADDGTLAIESTDGSHIEGAGRIVDGGDFGDSYNYAPPATDRVIEAAAAVEVVCSERGPLRGRVRIGRLYDWPAGVEADGSARTAAEHTLEVLTDVELRAGEPFVRVSVAFENRSDDHRVRWHVPLARPADVSHAHGQFAVVERGLHPESGYHEEPLATYPAHGWVDAGGVAILLDHLTEYELLPADASGRGELAVTMLRSIGLISRNDNPYREDPAGPQIPIPTAQLRGPWRCAFALMPHAGTWLDAGVTEAAEAYSHELLPTAGAAARDAAWPPQPGATAGLELIGDGVALSALRRRGEGWLEARVVNLADRPTTATIRGVTAARESDLLGGPGAATDVTDGDLRLNLGPAEIRTVQVQRIETATAAPDILDIAGPRESD